MCKAKQAWGITSCLFFLVRIFETKFCAGTHSGGQVRYDSDTQRIYAVLGTFLGTRTNIPSVTRVICNIVCQRDDKRKKLAFASFYDADGGT